MIKLVEICRATDATFGGKRVMQMREVYINPVHVVCMYDDAPMKKNLLEGRLPEDLDERQSFTKLHLNQGQSLYQITVVGSMGVVGEKLGLTTDKRQLLHD